MSCRADCLHHPATAVRTHTYVHTCERGGCIRLDECCSVLALGKVLHAKLQSENELLCRIARGLPSTQGRWQGAEVFRVTTLHTNALPHFLTLLAGCQYVVVQRIVVMCCAQPGADITTSKGRASGSSCRGKSCMTPPRPTGSSATTTARFSASLLAGRTFKAIRTSGITATRRQQRT